jgi:hypothetical protein
MGIASWLGIGKEITKPVEAIGDALDNLFTSDDERLSRAEMMERLQQKPLTMQATLDKIYAKSSNKFISSARPFCVWVAGLNIVSLNVGVIWFSKSVPSWYADASVTAFIGALGLYGAARTIEKMRDKTK